MTHPSSCVFAQRNLLLASIFTFLGPYWLNQSMDESLPSPSPLSFNNDVCLKMNTHAFFNMKVFQAQYSFHNSSIVTFLSKIFSSKAFRMHTNGKRALCTLQMMINIGK